MEDLHMKIFMVAVSFILLISCTQITENWYLTPDEIEQGKLRAQRVGHTLYYDGTKKGNYVTKKRIYHEVVPFADQARSTLMNDYNWWTFDE